MRNAHESGRKGLEWPRGCGGTERRTPSDSADSLPLPDTTHCAYRSQAHTQLWLFAFPDRSASADTKEVSRFSCILFLGVPVVFDYAGPGHGSRSIAICRCGLPADRKESAPGSEFSELNNPAHRCLCLRFACRLAATGARLGGQDGVASPFL